MSRFIGDGTFATRPWRRSATRRRYRPSGARAPLSVRPSQVSRIGVNARAGCPSARRRTSSPSALTTLTVTSSASLRRSEIVWASRRPSPLGEKYFVSFRTSTTDGVLLRRWATKKAENVAPTSSTNTTRAIRVKVAS